MREAIQEQLRRQGAVEVHDDGYALHAMLYGRPVAVCWGEEPPQLADVASVVWAVPAEQAVEAAEQWRTEGAAGVLITTSIDPWATHSVWSPEIP